MPEHSSKSKHQRPTSDIILETGRMLLTEVEKNAVADSNKQISMLLARSRSLDVISSVNEKIPHPNRNINHNFSSGDNPSSPAEERDCEQLNVYVANSAVEVASSSGFAESFQNNGRSMKDETASTSVTRNTDKRQNLTLLKEKSDELNNNHRISNDRRSISPNRSSCSSSISTTSSNYSSSSKANHHKLQRRSSSSTQEGATAFQEVTLKPEPIRITGHLEKRSKVLGWKKFWFVLDGRLLTYYKSKVDYESLSACCGCINLGIATTVRPIQIRGCKGYPLQIVTRSQIYYLRSQEKPILEQWLIAIQEAASSPPSTSVLTSWNSYSGSQYFKNSFTSQSQWSLNNSSDDISNITNRLGNLPDTFYQKRDRNSLVLSNLPSHVSPGIQKYHSFASLQTPIVNDLSSKRKILISSSDNLRDLQETNGKSVRNTHSTMQQSTSLLVLDSSPQAAELRKELTRKLSIGSPKNSHTGPLEEEDATVPTPKFLLLSAKKKLQMGPSADNNESHDYAEIDEFMEGNKVKKPYENCDVEKTGFANSAPHQLINSSNNNRHVRGDSAEKDSNIYEHVEAVDSTPAPVTPAMVWEPLNEGNNAIANNKRFPTHRMNAGSNRNSLVSISELPEDLSSISPSPIKTPVLTSIPEASWKSGIEPFKSYHNNYSEDDLSSCRSESFRSLPCVEKSAKKRKGKALSGFLSKVFGKNKGKTGKSESLESIQRPMVISGPVDLRNMQETKPESAPETIVQPHTTGATNRNISGNFQQQNGAKTSPQMAGSRMTINNTIVMDELKQKVGHITLKRTNSKDYGNGNESSTDDTDGVGIQKQNSLKGKAEARVPYVPRANPTLINTSPEKSKQTPVLIFQSESKSSESNTDDDNVETIEPENEVQVASICMSPEYETPTPDVFEHTGTKQDDKANVEPSAPASIPILFEARSAYKPSTPDPDFQTKLAKFNRLSQRLSASLIAASMNPPPHASHHIGRSQSYKVNRKKGRYGPEEIPPLPPKKKNFPNGGSTGTIAIYDVPSNNTPVRSESFKLTSAKECVQQPIVENSISAYIRGITKKNSTPDIVISGNNAKLFGLRDEDPKEFRRALNTNSDENLDIHKSSPSLPPPRPPKPKPPAKPKSLEMGLNRTKRNSESSSASSETITEPQIVTPSTSAVPTLTMQTLQVSSLAASNKSLDIDTLDALSDVGLSDTKASNSPPDSPKVCPLHPEAFQEDLSLSTIARTPDSLMSISDSIAPDSLVGTPDTEIFQPSDTPQPEDSSSENNFTDSGPLSINKLEILIRDNDASPGSFLKSPDNESRLDSLERRALAAPSITPKPNFNNNSTAKLLENIKFATVSTLIQEFETVQENEEEISELYDDFPAEFYTPTPSSFSGYCPSDSSTSTDSPVSSSSSASSAPKRHDRIDAIRNSGMEQLEAFLSFGSSSDDCSFESCNENLSEESAPKVAPASLIPSNNNNNISKKGAQQLHPPPITQTTGGVNRTGAISRLGHSSAIGHLQKILTSDVK